jgi:hypothetical protein
MPPCKWLVGAHRSRHVAEHYLPLLWKGNARLRLTALPASLVRPNRGASESVDAFDMTLLPAWTEADWTSRVDEPFRSDRQFWASLAASADAVISLVAAAAVAVVLALAGDRAWSVLPFVMPAGLAARAVWIGRSSSRRSRAAFPDRQSWRDAERTAVATSFFRALRRPRHRRVGQMR